ncbi:fibronectin type III domain-containing protein [Flectobacillus roseus]|uniref:Fibronectin type III domain-containing protein n=1 Tax=Flectobacillus roseus TaxID=502259 RepID=A0ABT6YDE6_9BACT|nr:fibronectin type III domain-containing protein [Flectobacillus roseus]MDI9861608.1 fibronectin type III domain-containing protein [Flectobacillus roseus]
MAKLGLHTYQNSVRFKQLIVLTLLLVAGQLQGVAQQYFPVVARFTQLPPYPVYLSDFSNPAQTNLSIQVQMNDKNIASRAFRIRVYIEGQGFLIQSTDFVQGEPSITLVEGQVYNIPAPQVANYFKQYNLKITPEQYRKPFNEGAFRFGVEIIDFQTNRPISGIQWSTPVWLVVNEPPVWVMPQNQISVTPTNPQNINFQWAPRHNNVNDVEYEFTITDLMLNSGFQGNVQNLFLSQPAYYQTRTRNTVLNYNATMPPLVVGRTYAYRVQAVAKRGSEDVGVFRNNGYSEIQYFTYGEAVKLNPPTNLQVAWTDDLKSATFNWKGDNTHKNFTVEFRDKASKEWKTVTLPASQSGLYNTFVINNLDPNKSYEMRVTGINEQGIKATSNIIDLANSPMAAKKVPLVIKGNVRWAFRSSEENLRSIDPLLIPKDKERYREINYEPYPSNTPGSKKFPLGKATVAIYNSSVELTAENLKSSNPKRITTVNTNAEGEYSLDGAGLKLLTDVKNLYIVAEFEKNVFAPAISKLSVNPNDEGTKTVDELILLANTIRYSPRLLINPELLPAGESIQNNTIEEVGLYIYEKIVLANPYLKEAGNLIGEKPIVTSGGEKLIKVSEFIGNPISALFPNIYGEPFFVRVKHKYRNASYQPLEKMLDLKEGQLPLVKDHFRHGGAVPPEIAGVVERKIGDKMYPAPNVSIQLGQLSARTDKDGKYSIHILANVPKQTTLKIKAIDPLITSNVVEHTLIYDQKDITQNFVLSGSASYYEGRVYGRNQQPISGVKVSYKGSDINTNAQGYFYFVQPGENTVMDDSVKVTFDGYDVAYVQPKKFKRTAITGKDFDENKKNILPLMKYIKEEKDDQKDAFFKKNFKDPGLIPAASFNCDSVILQHETIYQVIAYTNIIKSSGMRSANDSSNVVSALLNIEDEERIIGKATYAGKNKNKESWKGGYVSKTFKKEISIKVLNRKVVGNDTTASPQFLEEEITAPLPNKYTKNDTVVVKVRLKPTSFFYGVVYDSTFAIPGVREGRKAGDPYKGVAGVEVSVSGSKAKTDENGRFKVAIPKGEEFEVELSHADYANTKQSFTALLAQPYLKPSGKPFYMVKQDKDMPKFNKLMGFTISVDRIVKLTDKTFQISGLLYLDKGKLGKDSTANIFSAGSTKTLTYKNIEVFKDENKKNAGNAIITQSSINFVETEAKILLFGYAPITLQGNPIGEPYIRLQHLDNKGTKLGSEGKIGASEMEFTQKEMMGITFGKMELSQKVPDKEKKFGKFDDKISDKDAAKRETAAKDAKAEQKEIKAKVEEANKNDLKDIIAAKNSSQAKKDEAAKELAKLDNGLTAVPEKEPMLLAFAPVSLEELADTKEYVISFPQANAQKDTKDLTASKPSTDKKDANGQPDKTPKEDPYKDYFKFPIGPTLGVVSAGIDPASAVLKKSGISMKGIVSLPEVWRFKSNGKPLLIEKLEIDKKFDLKTLIIGKSDTITSFGVADKWMCYIKSFQIYSGFKGFGLGGTINTDKDNYLIINSLGFSVVGGAVYPNIDLSTSKDGLRFGSLRFKTVGKKNITIKGNVDDKSYEVEGSLRIEWDESPLKTTSTDSTDKFGKRLSDAEIAKNKQETLIKDQNAKNEAEQATQAVNKGTKEYTDAKQKLEAVEKELVALEKLKADLTKEYDDLSKEQEKVKVKRIALTRKGSESGSAYRESEQAKQDEKNQVEAENAVKNKEKDIDARWKQYESNFANKEKERDKLKETIQKLEPAQNELAKKAEEAKAEAAKKAEADAAKKKADEEKKEAIANGKSYVDTSTKDAGASKGTEESKGFGGVSWKERLFPIEVQVFKWSTTGKFLISASLSQDALKYGPAAFKVRRIVYSRGAALKQSELNDLLKMSEDEVAKINSTSKFNNANTHIDQDGKRTGVTSEDTQKQREGASLDNMSLKAIEDKVALDNPSTVKWALGFAGGVEVDTKSINIDSDVNFYIADFDGKGHAFKMNELLIKIDATSFRALAKVKIATSGSKIGFEGEGEFEGAKIKAAMTLKYYSINDTKNNKFGTELGASIKVSTGVTGVVMGPITWTTLGGGFDLNTADNKFSVFFLGDARSTGVPEKVTYYKKVKLSLDFVSGNCGGVPIIRGSMELWSGMLNAKEEKICEANAEVNFCTASVVCKINCDLKFSDKMVKVDALAYIKGSAGFFLGAKVKAELFGMNSNGTFILGILCDTKHSDAPKELAPFLTDLPRFLYQSDNKTLSALYVGLDLSYEEKKNGGLRAFGVDFVSYSAEVLCKTRLNAGVNFSNGNFMINAMAKVEAEGKASVLGFNMGGKLDAMLELGGGRTNELGWNFRAIGRGKLEIGAGRYEDKQCNDYSITGIKWGKRCITCCDGTSWRCWKRIEIPYPEGSIDRFVKLCLEGQFGVTYQEKGPREVTGWKAYIGGTGPGTNAPSKSNSVPTESAVTAETSLRVGESRVSPNGVYKLIVEDNGNVAITKNGDKIWETNTANRGVSYFKVQQDGNLVAYTSSDRAVWASNTHGKGNNSCILAMQDDGNLVLYKDGDNAIWSSDTRHVYSQAEIINSRILNETSLKKGQTIKSASGVYALTLQGDGNVVLEKGSTVLWATGTNRENIEAFTVQDDGNIVAYAKGRRPKWSSRTNGKGGSDTVLLLQNDGNLVLYKNIRTKTPGNITVYLPEDAIWATGTNGK